MMLCDVKGCTSLAEYLRVIKIDKDRHISFSLCAEHNKKIWKCKTHGHATK